MNIENVKKPMRWRMKVRRTEENEKDVCEEGSYIHEKIIKSKTCYPRVKLKAGFISDETIESSCNINDKIPTNIVIGLIQIHVRQLSDAIHR